jgi:paraquat-inducible protein B
MPEATPPAPELDPPPAESARGISLVWLVPLLALVVALVLAWRTYYERGPLIEIVFENAAGVEAGKTPLRFRDVGVGIVEKTSLSPDLQHVIVTVRVNKDVAQYLDGDAQFWVVRPSVTPQGVTGIETVLSGVYIGAYWNTEPGERKTRFDGLPRAPLTPADQPGLRIRLRAPDGGSMTIGAPVLFKRIQVGRIEDISLTDAGDVMIDLFVGAPNDIRVTQGSRFWNASGFSINIGGGGASLNVESLISLLQGGISFDTVGSDTAPAADGDVFELYPSEVIARQNLFEDAPGERLIVNTDFDGSVRGLQPGAPVEFHGIKVGEVRSLQAAIVDGADGAKDVTLRTTLALVPARLGITDTTTGAAPDAALDLLESQVRGGLRARLAASGILTQTLYVDLVEVPGATPATLDRDAQPYPILPSAPSDITGIAASAETVMQRLAKLPLEDLVEAAVTLLANANAIVTSEGVRQAPENLGLLLADARTLIGQEGIQQAPAQVAAILASARALVDQATEQQLVANLDEVLATAKASLASIGTAADGVPKLIDEIEALAAKLTDLPLDQLAASAKDVVDGIDAFVRSEGVANLPASVQASLDDLRGVVADLRTGGAVDNVNATLASVRSVADQAAEADLVARLDEVLTETRNAAASVGTAADGVPPLLDEVSALTAKAQALPLSELAASANRLVDKIDAFVTSDDFANLPASLQVSLSELRGVVVDLRAGGAVDNVNASLASIRQVTDELAAARLTESIETVVTEAKAAIANLNSASAGLPALMDRVDAIAADVEALPLEDLVARATQVLATADTFLASEGVQALPPKLDAALEQLRAILAELNEGGAAQNVNATLASASRAADAVTAAADELPALVARLNALAAAADAAIATVGPNSRINRDTLLLLQEVRDAARSVNALVSALERRPNSVIFGR